MTGVPCTTCGMIGPRSSAERRRTAPRHRKRWHNRTRPIVRILTLTPRVLYPPDTGGRIRSLKLLQGLARRHEVTLVCFQAPEDRPEQFEMMRAWCADVETIEWRPT